MYAIVRRSQEQMITLLWGTVTKRALQIKHGVIYEKKSRSHRFEGKRRNQKVRESGGFEKLRVVEERRVCLRGNRVYFSSKCICVLVNRYLWL